MKHLRMHQVFFLFASLSISGVLGCSGKGSSQATLNTPITSSQPVTSSTTSTPASSSSMGGYNFYKSISEQGLKDETNYGFVIVKTSMDFNPANFVTLGLTVQGQLTFGGSAYYHLYKDHDVLSTLGQLGQTRGVLYANPELKAKAFGSSGISYNDPDPLTVAEQYSAYITHAMDAWTTFGFGSARPVIVDVDTGVNWAHEDFQSNDSCTVTHAFSWWNLSTNTYLSGASRPLDYIGTSTTNTDEDSHGTHTMGTLGAQGNNGKGVAGVCWQADLISYKVLNDKDPVNSGSEWAIYSSVVDLAQNRSAITTYTGTIPVNMSLGGLYVSPFDIDVIQYGLSNNIVVVCAMGNSGDQTAMYPAAIEGVIAVGATDGCDKKATFSSTGPNISVCAPGLNIISTGNIGTSEYLMDSGTSMATPFVTGLVGYMLTFAPNLTPAQIKTELETYADPLGGNAFSDTTGHGRVNVFNTIKDVAAKVASQTQLSQNYNNNPFIITINNSLASTNNAAVPGFPVYLYNTDDKGNINKYVSCSFSDDTGQTSFSLLPAGNYIATTTICNQSFSTNVVTVSPDNSAIPSQTISVPILWARLLADQGTPQMSASNLILADATSEEILSQAYISTLPYSLPMVLTKGKSYLLVLETTSTTSNGEYALYINSDPYPNQVAHGSFSQPFSYDGSQSSSFTYPQLIQLKTLYNGDLFYEDVYEIVP